MGVEELAWPTRNRVTGIIYLHNARHGLDQAKDDCENEYQRRDPEGVPLNLLSPVSPPLSEGFGLGVIVSLL